MIDLEKDRKSRELINENFCQLTNVNVLFHLTKKLVSDNVNLIANKQ